MVDKIYNKYVIQPYRIDKRWIYQLFNLDTGDRVYVEEDKTFKLARDALADAMERIDKMDFGDWEEVI